MINNHETQSCRDEHKSAHDAKMDKTFLEGKYTSPRRVNTEPSSRTASPFITKEQFMSAPLHLIHTKLPSFSNFNDLKAGSECKNDAACVNTKPRWAVISPFWLCFSLATVILTVLSWVLHFVLGDSSPTAIFVSSFLALLLQAYILGYATEQLSLSSGEKIAALLNVSFGNAVELIVAVIALTKCELDVVQSSLVGSVFSNLLLVTGMALIAGGLRHGQQRFSSEEAQLQSALLVFVSCSILFPTASYILQTLNQDVDINHAGNMLHVFSRGSSIVSILVYACFLGYSMTISKRSVKNVGSKDKADPEGLHKTEDENEEEKPVIGRATALSLLVVITAVVGVTAEFLVSSLDGMTSQGPLSKQFVSVILLPIVGNAAEHCSAIMLAVKDKTRMSLDIAVGSSLQISLFVLPVSVLLGWCLDKPLSLYFDPLQAIVLLVSVLLVSFIVQDGKSNWMEGVLLFALFVNLCVVFQVYPGFGSTEVVNACT